MQASEDPERMLDTTALYAVPGFLIRLAQLKFFDGFYEAFSKFELTPATYSILLLVRDNPGVPPSNVATTLRLQLPNLTKLLNELESRELIVRRRSAIDRRAVELLLTAKGGKLIKKAVEATESYNQKILAPLDRDEQAVLANLLARMLSVT